MASVVVIAAAMIFGVRVFTAPEEAETAPQGAERRVPARFLQAAAHGHRLGQEDAPVVLLLYTDYYCSFCIELDIALEDVRRRYPDHLAVVVKPFTLLGTGADANLFLAAECAADQGLFEAFHSTAMQLRVPGDRATGWKTVADSVGVPDRGMLSECVQTMKHAQRIEDAYDEGSELGVLGTPTFFVNGAEHAGSFDLAVLDSIVASALPRVRRVGR